MRRWSPRGAAPRSLHLVAQVVHEGVKMNLAFRKRTLKPAPAAVPGGTSGGAAEAGPSLVFGAILRFSWLSLGLPQSMFRRKTGTGRGVDWWEAV